MKFARVLRDTPSPAARAMGDKDKAGYISSYLQPDHVNANLEALKGHSKRFEVSPCCLPAPWFPCIHSITRIGRSLVYNTMYHQDA